jgi:hypothetical protein
MLTTSASPSVSSDMLALRFEGSLKLVVARDTMSTRLRSKSTNMDDIGSTTDADRK